MDKKTFDYIVIGGGSGGIASARKAASFEAKVAVVEKSLLGGTCVNVGCVPKKVMWNAAQIRESLVHSPDYGFSSDVCSKISYPKLKAARDSYVKRLNGIYASMLENSGVDFFAGHASFVNNSTVQVGNTQLEASHILIATGGRPVVPDVEGASLGMHSDQFFAMETLPERVVVIGTGYIGVEVAGVLAGLGSEVTVVSRSDRVLTSFGRDVGLFLKSGMEHAGIKFECHANVSKLSKSQAHKNVHLENGKIIEADAVIWAVGRRPQVENLGLENLTAKKGYNTHTEQGGLWTDEHQNTAYEGIYAVGDVITKLDLTPVAIAAGRHLARRLFGGEPETKLDYTDVPTVIFSHPPVATIGLNEEDAVSKHGKDSVKVYRSEFINMYYSPLDPKLKEKTLMKLICLGPDEKIIGMQMVGKGADEIMQGFAVAIKMGARKSDLDRTVAIHPTAAEEFVTMT